MISEKYYEIYLVRPIAPLNLSVRSFVRRSERCVLKEKIIDREQHTLEANYKLKKKYKVKNITKVIIIII